MSRLYSGLLDFESWMGKIEYDRGMKREGKDEKLYNCEKGA